MLAKNEMHKRLEKQKKSGISLRNTEKAKTFNQNHDNFRQQNKKFFLLLIIFCYILSFNTLNVKLWKIYKSIDKEFESFLYNLFLSFGSLKTPTVTVLFHISDSESSEWRIFGEGLTAHWLGFMVTKAESALLMAFGSSLVALPVLLPIFSLICSNLQAMWAVWQSKGAVTVLNLNWRMINWAKKLQLLLVG